MNIVVVTCVPPTCKNLSYDNSITILDVLSWRFYFPRRRVPPNLFVFEAAIKPTDYYLKNSNERVFILLMGLCPLLYLSDNCRCLNGCVGVFCSRVIMIMISKLVISLLTAIHSKRTSSDLRFLLRQIIDFI